jgi:hypothetical protein
MKAIFAFLIIILSFSLISCEKDKADEKYLVCP